MCGLTAAAAAQHGDSGGAATFVSCSNIHFLARALVVATVPFGRRRRLWTAMVK